MSILDLFWHNFELLLSKNASFMSFEEIQLKKLHFFNFEFFLLVPHVHCERRLTKASLTEVSLTNASFEKGIIDNGVIGNSVIDKCICDKGIIDNNVIYSHH